MDWKIGEIRQIKNEWYQCLEDTNNCHCDDCDLDNIVDCNQIACTNDERIDTKKAYFKKLEKVGEPYTNGCKLFQRYKLFTPTNKLVNLEIKQTKEDMEEKKLNLKPFDVQKAKAGKPVCTRDGRSARIICFDVKGDKPIIALIEYEIDERPCNYFVNGRFYSNPNENNDADLMMLPEKKEGWAKVRKDINLYDTKEDADRKMIGNDEYVTAKVCWEE